MNRFSGPGLADPDERARLTPAARSAADGLRRAWALSAAEIVALVGLDEAAADVVVAGAPPMSRDQLQRVGLLVGMYADLHRLHRADLADAWVTRPNTNPLFDGLAPLAVML